MMRQQYDDLGPVSEIDFLGSRWTLLLGPDACGAALLNADKALASGPGWGKLVGPFFDRGLMLLDFEEHHQHRRLMQQAFTRRRLAGYTASLGPAVAAGLATWEPHAEFQIFPALKELTLELATQVFMGGVDLASDDELAAVNGAFVACVQAATGDRATADPGHPLGQGSRRAAPPGGLLRQARREQASPVTGRGGRGPLLGAVPAARRGRVRAR